MTCDSVVTLVFGRKTRCKCFHHKCLRAEHRIRMAGSHRRITNRVWGVAGPVGPCESARPVAGGQIPRATRACTCPVSCGKVLAPTTPSLLSCTSLGRGNRTSRCGSGLSALQARTRFGRSPTRTAGHRLDAPTASRRRRTALPTTFGGCPHGWIQDDDVAHNDPVRESADGREAELARRLRRLRARPRPQTSDLLAEDEWGDLTTLQYTNVQRAACWVNPPVHSSCWQHTPIRRYTVPSRSPAGGR